MGSVESVANQFMAYGKSEKKYLPERMNMNHIMETITKRRSIRRYTAEEVAEPVLQDIMEAARWAPSWAR